MTQFGTEDPGQRGEEHLHDQPGAEPPTEEVEVEDEPDEKSDPDTPRVNPVAEPPTKEVEVEDEPDEKSDPDIPRVNP
jgi:hypothetical protein